MARNKSRKSEDAFSLLLSLPWWVPLLAAVPAYGVFAHSSRFLALVAVFALILLAAATAYAKWRRGELLERVASLESLKDLTWQDFELMVGEAYRRNGYIVSEAGGGGPDGGIDLILRKGAEKVIVQCKRWKTQQVGVSPLRELRGIVAREKATRGIFVTSGTFTQEAIDEAEGQPLGLVDGQSLLKLVHQVRFEKQAPLQPQRMSQDPRRADDGCGHNRPTEALETPICPKCQRPMVLRRARRGNNAGSQFWGCRDYPSCHGTRQI